MYKVLIIADNDLDGTGSAVIVTKFVEMFNTSMIPFKKAHQVDVLFPSRQELDDLFSDQSWCREAAEKYNHIYLCDTCPNSSKAHENIGMILAPKMTVFDHHATNYDRLYPYKARFTGVNGGGFHIEEGERCSAKITFDTLKGTLYSTPADKFNVFKKFAGLVNDLDLWYRMFPRSSELGDYVASVGAAKAYHTLLKIAHDPDKNVDDMEEVISNVAKEKARSLELAKKTLVKHKGYKTPFHTCLVDDWSSWVAGEICPKSGMIAMFDVRKKSLSFRVGSNFAGTAWHKAKGKKPNCLDFAEPLGGGGHPQAAGVSTAESCAIFKELSRRMGELLLEN